MTNDIGQFKLNQMTFNSGAPTYTLGGVAGLDFWSNTSSFAPSFVMNSDNNFMSNVPITLSNDLAIRGTGSGTIEFDNPINGGGSLTYSGAGTLNLAAATNGYIGGTVVNSGTLALRGTTADLPIGGNVTVGNGAGSSGQLKLNTLSNSTAATAIGTLFVNGGAVDGSSGLFGGTFYLNQLNMTGGTVDLSASPNGLFRFTGTGAKITTNSTSTTATWIGNSTSGIVNDTAGPLTIAVDLGTSASGIDLDAGIALSSMGSHTGFIKDGAGVMRLTSLSNGAAISVTRGTLRVDDVSSGPSGFGALGSGGLTLSGGTLEYGGTADANLAKNISLTSRGFVVVSNPGTTLTYSGTMTEASTSYFGMSGPGAGQTAAMLSLTGNQNYSSVTIVDSNGVLAIPSIGNIGSASPIGTGINNPGVQLGFADSSSASRGTLLLTGTGATYSTDRELRLWDGSVYDSGGGGAIGVQNAGTTLTWNGKVTGTSTSSGSLIKTGDGTLFLADNRNDYTGGTWIEGGRLHVGLDVALGTGPVTIKTGGTLRYTAPADTAPARSLTLAGGTVESPVGITVVAPNALSGYGAVTGNLTNSGSVIVSPSGTSATLGVTGNYSQTSTAALEVFVDLIAAPQFSGKLSVGGNLALGGTLQLLAAGISVFHGTRSFDVLDWSGTLGGQFNTLSLPTNGGTLAWDTSQLYTTGVLSVSSVTDPGDYNADGVVDAADYTVWRDHLGQSFALPNRSTANTGPISAADYDVWKTNFGQIAGSGLSSAVNVAVSEPATSLLLMIAAASSWARSRCSCMRISKLIRVRL
jgi:autotransporter-associated beta strand protein